MTRLPSPEMTRAAAERTPGNGRADDLSGNERADRSYPATSSPLKQRIFRHDAEALTVGTREPATGCAGLCHDAFTRLGNRTDPDRPGLTAGSGSGYDPRRARRLRSQGR